MPAHAKIIAIERDGTLNQLPEDFMRAADDWVPLPGALEALSRLNQGGWRVVVYASQSGLARGLFDMTTVNEVHARMHKLLAAAGARVEAVFFCPHMPDETCDCKQPGSGLLSQISQRTGTPLTQLVVAGGTVAYLKVALAAGCDTHLILAGRASGNGALVVPEGIHVHTDLMALADAVLARDALAGS
ncbi:MAG TPA: HAD-IIIA family hydrolase [Macromonas sp.]|nr:HAD-IIIA family hydrolase [Macromonas sp.]